MTGAAQAADDHVLSLQGVGKAYGGTPVLSNLSFAARTGEELWATDVGAAAHTVPITYQGRDRKQYVAVMVSGGGYLGDPIVPAKLMVFSLPGTPMSEQ